MRRGQSPACSVVLLPTRRRLPAAQEAPATTEKTETKEEDEEEKDVEKEGSISALLWARQFLESFGSNVKVLWGETSSPLGKSVLTLGVILAAPVAVAISGPCRWWRSVLGVTLPSACCVCPVWVVQLRALAVECSFVMVVCAYLRIRVSDFVR